MLTAIKYRAYPTNRQQSLLARMFGNQRFVYNHFLVVQKTKFSKREKLVSRFDMMAELPSLMRQYPWLAESKVDALRISIESLDSAFVRFFGKQSRFPKFKSKRARRSVTTCQPGKNRLFSRSLGAISVVEHEPPPGGKVKWLTISKSPSGRYFQSAVIETSEPPVKPVAISGVIGLDEGLTNFVALSTGRKIKHGRCLRANLARLKREQRRLARKARGSNRRECQRIKVAKLHEKIANARAYEMHLVSTNLVRKAVYENQGIAFQKSNIINQARNRHLALSISDAGWGLFRIQLRYKCARVGIPLLEVSQWEPTSYVCSQCRVKAQEKTLRDRTWICAGCGSKIDRDVNAARVIARVAWQEYTRREAPCLDAEGSGAVKPPYEASSCESSAKRMGVPN